MTRKGAIARGKERKVEVALHREEIGSYWMIPIFGSVVDFGSSLFVTSEWMKANTLTLLFFLSLDCFSPNVMAVDKAA